MYFHTIDEALNKALMKQFVEADNQRRVAFSTGIPPGWKTFWLNSRVTGLSHEFELVILVVGVLSNPDTVPILESLALSHRKHEAGPTTVWQLGLILNLLTGDTNFTLDKLHLKSHWLRKKIMELYVSNACEHFFVHVFRL